MTKQSSLIKLVALVAAMMCALGASAAQDVCDFIKDGIFYKIQSNGTSVYVWYEDGSSWDPCYLLEEYDIPETVTYNGTTYTVTGIGHTAFYGCTALTRISLPRTLTNIDSQAFTGCTSLNTVYCYAITPPSLYSNAFDETAYDNVLLYVPSSAVSTYQAATNWKYFDNIQPIFTNDEAYACYTPSNTTLTFYYDDLRSTRTGTTYDLNTGYSEPGWHADGTYSSVTKVVFNPSFTNARPTTTNQWFFYMENLQSITGINYLNTSEVTNMNVMFYFCSSLTSLDVSHFNTANVRIMYGMFDHCSSLTSLDVSHFNTANVIDMNYMFRYCSGLTSLDVSNFNTANVTTMGDMFCNCNALASLDLSSFKTSKVTNMENMFWGCNALTSLDLSGFNTENVTKMGLMFCNCNALASLDVSNFNTAKVTTMNRMFQDCYKLKTLDLSSFNTSKVTNMTWMFGWCYDLERIYVSDLWSTASVTSSSDMFKADTKLVGGQGTTYDANHVGLSYAHIDGGPDNPGYFTEKRWVSLDEALNAEGSNIHFESTGDYPWRVMQEDNNFYAQSGNAGVPSSTSTLTATVTAADGDILSFDLKAWGEGTSTFWDRCSFKIEGVEQIAYGAHQNEEWETYRVYLLPGENALEWSYTKDGSIDNPGDYFAISNVYIYRIVKRGDLNGDGNIDVSDVTLLIAAVLNDSSVDMAVADMNNDNSIDVSDVTALIAIVLNN